MTELRLIRQACSPAAAAAANFLSAQMSTWGNTADILQQLGDALRNTCFHKVVTAIDSDATFEKTGQVSFIDQRDDNDDEILPSKKKWTNRLLTTGNREYDI